MKQISMALALIITLTVPGLINAQNTFPSNGSAGIGTTTPDASSILEVKSTTKGMLIPRMSKTDRDAIGSPATGLMIFQTNNTPGFYYYDGNGWKQMTGANKSLNNLSGPTAVNVDLLPAANASLNFGTSSFAWNNAYLSGSIFMNGDKFISRPGTYNTFIGQFSGESDTAGFANTGTGAGTLRANTSGNYNTADGYISLYSNTTGAENSAFGTASLNTNTIGSFNTAVGSSALFSNTNGSSNTSIGAYSLYINGTGFNNTASGTSALYLNTSGYHNTANGSSALRSNTTGKYNSAVGAYALFTNTTGSENTAVGRRALYFSKTAQHNTAVGNEALYNNTASENTAIGYQALYYNAAAEGSTAVGTFALFRNTIGVLNTAIGVYALLNNTSGNLNSAHGSYTLQNNKTGSNNTAVGTQAGSYADANNYCSFLGYDANQPVGTNFTNSMALGNASRVTANNQVRIGNSSITSIGGYTDWSNISDGRFKRNLKENVPGLSFINKLKPVTYNLDITSLRKFVGEDVSYDKDGHQKLSAEPDEKTKQAIDKKEKLIQTGFVAQDVEKAAKELGYDFSGVDKPENESSAYGLRYSEFVVPLVKAVQELSKMNDNKDARLESQDKKIDALQKQIDELKTMIGKPTGSELLMSDELSAKTKLTSPGSAGASLSQNVPNPFNHTTTITYVLPQQFTNAQIAINDKTGKPIKTINVSGSGKGSLTLDASSLASGTYIYSLYLNGKLNEAKQMMLAR